MRGSKAEGAISRNSRILGGILRRNFSLEILVLGILEFLGFLGVRGYFLVILDLGILDLGILDLGILEFLGNSKLALSFKIRGSGSKN